MYIRLTLRLPQGYLKVTSRFMYTLKSMLNTNYLQSASELPPECLRTTSDVPPIKIDAGNPLLCRRQKAREPPPLLWRRVGHLNSESLNDFLQPLREKIVTLRGKKHAPKREHKAKKKGRSISNTNTLLSNMSYIVPSLIP